jgi:hypothetical protein
MPPGNTTIVMKTDAVEGTAHAYRLAKIVEIQKEIETERDKRAVLNTKYRKGVRVINVVDTISDLVALASGAATITVLSTIVAAPIAVALQALAVGAGVFSVIGRVVNRKLTLKSEKHRQIKTLAEAKLNTITDYVSKALEDGYISDEEYSLIQNELTKFNEMKEEIRSETKVSIDEEPGIRETMTESFKNVGEKK